MNEVTQIKASTIAAALAKAQAEMGKALKSSDNPHFRSKYADLGNVMDACLPALNKHGIAVIQPTIDDETGRYVETVLLHDSGETLRCRVPLIVQKNDMQGYGSAVTYARRYGMMCMAGIAPEDDDGNAAAKAAPHQGRESAAINADQFIEVSNLIEETGADVPGLLKYIGATSVEEMTLQQFDTAMAALRKKKASAK